MKENITRIVVALSLSDLLIEFSGIVLDISIKKIAVLVIGSNLLELLIHYLCRKEHSNINLRETFQLFGKFIKKTALVMITLAIIVISMIVINHESHFSIFFYIHVFITVYTIGYVLCSNNVIAKTLKHK
ncbi:hypothetical protein [Streptococcus macacae]|uniref:Uncharacterized protein n=1 Tax=Streptococcus macacae NCTC 11558 TaxID=764298 RepID=G5JUX9_9STRE|nr:hypothetical protein [Streptococcus macacae]EHJ53176.1 hypothetical protein STRMA_1364 [Streptococcus macacae NCTC 11558]SUN79277.1 putative bacteriocin self-immunity protein [Streptococcus macacae NCTC 11558]